MLEIKNADTVENSNEYLSKIFVDGFYIWLKYFSKDRKRLEKAFNHMFKTEYFYLAIKDGIPAGMAAISDGVNLIVKLNKRELTKNLGAIMGRIAFHLLKKEFEVVTKHGLEYPELAFVSVLEDYRRQGIAEAMVRYAIESTPYQEYLLEVADNNFKAIHLYEKIGFKEHLRVPSKHKKQAGFDNFLYLLKRK